MSEAPARQYDPIAVSSESTVVAEFIPGHRNRHGLPVGG